MTSYESGSAGRRRVLGRGPGAAPRPAPPSEESRSVAEVAAPAEPGGHNDGEPDEATGPVVVPDEPSVAEPGGPSAAEPGGPSAAEPGGPSAAEPGGPEAVEPDEPSAAEPGGPEVVESGAPEVAEPGEPSAAEVAEPGEPSATEVAESGEPSVVEAEDPRDGVFKVRLANFEGPFDLLLRLISKHKMDVTEVALSKVTDEFMAHIRAMGPDWDLDQTTEFLVVAATLLDLKAARLLPAAEVEDEADLALLEARDLLFARLLQYRAYKRIADIFNERLDDEARRYPRTVGLEPHHAELLPEVVISIGPEGFARLAVKAMQPKAKPQVYVDHIHAPLVSVQEQAGIVVARLRELGEASFRALVEDTDDTLTVVARFLALLELYREKAVALDQETALGDLIVRWTGGDADAAPMVTDEFDRPPEEPKEPTASKEGKKA
ncbi:segregation/condensation protein A [Streptomyces sp. NPDC002523]